MKFGMKKLLSTAVVSASIAAMSIMSISACTAIYVGGNLTEDGNPIVARSEDYTNSLNKLAIISESGAYQEGELYIGCEHYGAFEWTWTHDSYRFTAFTADIYYDGVCPECGVAGHYSYTESGTNEMGVTVSATETLSGNGLVNGTDVDPMCQGGTDADGNKILAGIEETDIPTVILSEAATAREGIELLTEIYDEYGAYYCSGIFIADQNEIWYIENCSGTQYLAIKLHDDMMFLEPNVAILGEIDLDDTDNVIASDRLIEVAELAGCFVGDKDENIINYRASYARLHSGWTDAGTVSSKDRLSGGLNFVNSEYSYTEQDLYDDNTLFTISNIDAEGATVPFYTNIKADRLMTVDDIVNYYKVDGIANTGNTDTAFFQIDADEEVLELATTEWFSMSHGGYNVFIPTYPLLVQGYYEAYDAPVGEAEKHVTEKPDTDMYYRTSDTGTYVAYPENWQTSFYWTFDALSNYILYSAYDPDDDAVTADELAYVLEQLEVLQQEIYAEFDVLNAELADMDVAGDDRAAAEAAVTEYSAEMGEEAHTLALSLLAGLMAGDVLAAEVTIEVTEADADAGVSVFELAVDAGNLKALFFEMEATDGAVVTAGEGFELHMLDGTYMLAYGEGDEDVLNTIGDVVAATIVVVNENGADVVISDIVAANQDDSLELEGTVEANTVETFVVIRAIAALVEDIDELYATYDMDDYLSAQQDELAEIYDAAVAEVEAMTTLAEISAYDMDALTTDFDAVATLVDVLDLNGDGAVDYSDITCIASYFGHEVDDTNAMYDVNGDGEIVSSDYLLVYENMTI